MTRLHWCAAIAACYLLLHVCPVLACRYNVREVGFIDIGIEPYWLFVCAPEGTPAADLDGLRESVDALLAETNIRFEPITGDADPNHPARKFLSTHAIKRLPAAVLVSPDGQSRQLALPQGETSLVKAISSAVEAVLDSPVRWQILEKAVDNYGVVLLLEGPKPEDNAAARQAVSTAVGHIAEQLEFLPKPIARPPEIVTLEQASLAREEVLLWTLGLKPQDVNEPHAAVFYGRGRWIGPLLKGEMLAADPMTELLFVIGADCECGLDHRWLQGTMLPARWGQGLQEKVAANLGFDPENPMIKMEMVSIVRRGMGGFDYPGVPFGYREMEVGGEVPGSSVEAMSEPNLARAPMAAPVAQTVESQVETEWSGSAVGILAFSLGGMAMFVAAVSAVVLWRAKRA